MRRYREERKEAEEYNVLVNNLIRGIGGSFWTQFLYDRSPRGHINKGNLKEGPG